MNNKKIVGFENKEKYNNNNDICPNCNHRTSKFPLGVEVNEGFLGLHHKRYLEYTCDRCRCVWRV